MAVTSKEINQYTAASTIDAVNDQLLIDPGGTGAYNKINRNILLGITGSPIGSSDTQTLTNKILGNTNTITALDSGFTLQDNGDATKQAQFQLSGNTTGTTRTYALPNASVTLASLTGTETLTNKTITSPVISGGTIDNATVTVDAISGHTTSTIVTVANLQISNGVLNSANAVTATSVAAGAIQPQALVAGTGSGWGWQAWTPTWGNLTVGNGTVAAKYIQTGKLVTAHLQFTMGSTSSISGAVTFTLPVTATTAYSTLQNTIGGLHLDDVGNAGYTGIFELIGSTTVCSIYTYNASGTYVTESPVTATVPWTIGTNDFFSGTFMYEAA